MLTPKQECDLLSARLRELESLSREIVNFFHTQTFTSNTLHQSEDVCRAFSEMLLRHWNLGVITIYMRAGEGQPLREHDVRISSALESGKAHAASGLLAEAVEQSGEELQLWADDKNEDGEKNEDNRVTPKIRQAFQDAQLAAGIGVPIYARGETPYGVLVAACTEVEDLRPAIKGIRLIAEPIIMAVNNTYRAKAIRDQRHRIEQLVAELQHSNSALGEANHELQRVSLYRSLFLARMSHELRTPLTSVLGFAEILLDQEKLTPTQHRFCEKIQASGLQLQTSLKQLVDLSKLEAGQSEMFLHEFSLRETLRESCAAVSHLANKREVELDCQSPLELPTIVSDEGKLRQVLYNFFTYAIGRSARGESVTVYVEHVPPCRFRLVIHDEGDPVSDLNIFEPIDVGEPGASGTNLNELGLSIARRLIDVLCGTVTLQSTPPQKGLTVIIELPGRPTKE